jgi:hypothetical protein
MQQYPAVNAATVAFHKRLENNSKMTPEERGMAFTGFLACLEAFADYANAEETQVRISGEL